MSTNSNENDSTESMIEEEEEDAGPLVHNYLPGTSHPLYPEEVLLSSKKKQLEKEEKQSHGSNKKNEKIMELAVLYLDKIVLFPGSTLPIRLRNPKWMDYLGKKVEMARDCRGMEFLDDEGEEESLCCIGVLTKKRRSSVPHEDVIGRIGTAAVITHTHEDDEALQQRQLVITALGTHRFRILSRMDDYHNNSSFPLPAPNYGDMADIHIFQVQILPDDPPPLPPTSVLRYLSPPPSKQQHPQILNRILPTLSNITPIPLPAWKHIWPWHYISSITTLLQTSDTFKGLKIKHSRNDPVKYSFYLSANLPLGMEDKLQLLEMGNVTDRFRFIWFKLQPESGGGEESRDIPRHVRCARCALPIAKVHEIFTVNGAEGTTGAYVNEYGVIHQTMTFQNILDGALIYEGTPQTRDSWFPGYSWTIAYCRLCHSHLGWKFILCKPDTTQEEDKDNKEEELYQFWGFSNSSITTREFPSREDRVHRYFMMILSRSTTTDSLDSSMDHEPDETVDNDHDQSVHG